MLLSVVRAFVRKKGNSSNCIYRINRYAEGAKRKSAIMKPAQSVTKKAQPRSKLCTERNKKNECRYYSLRWSRPNFEPFQRMFFLSVETSLPSLSRCVSVSGAARLMVSGLCGG